MSLSRTQLAVGVLILLVAVLVLGQPVLERLQFYTGTTLTLGTDPSATTDTGFRVFSPGQSIRIVGSLAAQPYSGGTMQNPIAYAKIQLSSSWGWSKTTETNTAGLYSEPVNLPSQEGSYTITAKYAGTVEFGSSSATITVNVGAGTSTKTTTPTTQTTPATTTTKQTTVESTGTSTSWESSTVHATVTATGTTATGTIGIMDWLKQETTVLGYAVPNWCFLAVFLVLLLFLWRRRS